MGVCSAIRTFAETTPELLCPEHVGNSGCAVFNAQFVSSGPSGMRHLHVSLEFAFKCIDLIGLSNQRPTFNIDLAKNRKLI